MQRVIVGLDASSEASRALNWACAHSDPDAAIVAVRAFELHWIASAQLAVPVIPEDAELAAREALDSLIAETGDARVTGVVREGRAGPVVVAESAGADLIVVGHRGDSRIALMLGSTTNYVLHHSALPVVVVRGDRPDVTAPLRKVVVGVDDHDMTDAGGDNESVRAVRWAYSLPGVEQVRVVYAWHLPPLAIGVYPALTADFEGMDEAAYAVIDRVLAAAGPAPDGVLIEPASVRGTPGIAMVDESQHADLVVVGSRGVGALRGLILGSTSSEAVAHSHCPVCVVR
jgi:nucleotide-binding universal stress UspA family protein